MSAKENCAPLLNKFGNSDKTAIIFNGVQNCSICKKEGCLIFLNVL